MKHLISLKEQSAADLKYLLDLAIRLKDIRSQGRILDVLKGQTMIMLFQKTSTRTRLSFEAAMTELGGHAIFLDARTTQFALTDFALEIQAIMRYGQILMFRARHSADVLTAATFEKIPVIDACSEKYHPAQALSDILTMAEHSSGLENVKKVVWLGIENNVSNTLMLACVKLGIEFVLVCPGVDSDSVDPELNQLAEATGLVTRTLDIQTALKNADYVCTDTWMNMEFFDQGKIKPEFETEYRNRVEKFKPYQLTAELIDNFAPQAKIMHCMPCHLGYEISEDAVTHKNSLILDQAENRLHMQKAIILWLLEAEARVDFSS